MLFLLFLKIPVLFQSRLQSKCFQGQEWAFEGNVKLDKALQDSPFISSAVLRVWPDICPCHPCHSPRGRPSSSFLGVADVSSTPDRGGRGRTSAPLCDFTLKQIHRWTRVGHLLEPHQEFSFKFPGINSCEGKRPQHGLNVFVVNKDKKDGLFSTSLG